MASDTLLNLLSERSIECDSKNAVESLERLLHSLYRDVVLEQTRVEILLKILFKAPPDQVRFFVNFSDNMCYRSSSYDIYLS